MDFNKLRVMVVDDTMLMRRIVSGILKEIGVNNIIEAESGDMALKFVKEIPIDLILMDRKMPGKDGLVCLREIRTDRELKEKRKIPVIMVTAEASEADIKAGMGAGANAYITKPFELSELRDTILKILQ